MKKYNFDELIDRRHTDCVKYDHIPEKYQTEDYLPMWVADMDFRTPRFVIDAINNRLKQGIFGYTKPSEQYYESITKWLKHRFDFEVKADELHFLPGVVPGIFDIIQCFTNIGDKVMVQTPVYFPFFKVTNASSRESISAPLKIADNGYMSMDFEKIEEQIADCSLFLLCNPHNPGGIVWDVEDLKRLAHICNKNNVLVVSDEIHASMVLSPSKHTPFAMVSEEARINSITLMAPSKAFNIPGLITSYAVVLEQTIREKFFQYIQENDLAMGNVFSFDATCACYSEEGENWLNQMLAYLQNNIDYVFDFLKENCPKIGGMRPEASFLIFLDNRKLGLPQEELIDFYNDEARLYLNDGTAFGPQGEGFMRMNIAAPFSVIQRAMKQLKEAYDKRF
ncbi:MAG: MalY/PatB family protein [Bacteroidaceae bacterium]